MLVAAGILLAVVGAGAFLLRDDDTTVDVRPADEGTTTTSPETTTSTVAETESFEGIWPFASQSDVDAYLADPGVGMFLDAEQTALEFGREYLGMADPVATDRPTTVETGQVGVRIVPSPGAPMTTTVWMHVIDGVHTVYFAEAPNIRPVADATYGVTVDGSIVTVRGTSTSYEAHVDVEVRDADGNVLGRSYVMGGASGELLPYEGTVLLGATPSTPTGAVILSTSSAEDGSLTEATVIQVTFGSGAEVEFSVWFHREEELVEVRRVGPRTAGVLRQALETLVAGPTPYEQVNGLSSLFSEDTADVLASVTIDDGTAVVDLAYEVNNASTSAGSEAFLAELDATVFQFPTVERVEYRLRGSCDAFWTWLQYGECRTIPAN